MSKLVTSKTSAGKTINSPWHHRHLSNLSCWSWCCLLGPLLGLCLSTQHLLVLSSQLITELSKNSNISLPTFCGYFWFQIYVYAFCVAKTCVTWTLHEDQGKNWIKKFWNLSSFSVGQSWVQTTLYILLSSSSLKSKGLKLRYFYDPPGILKTLSV